MSDAVYVSLCYNVFISLVLLFTDNSPSEEPPATAEKEETEESDHEGEVFTMYYQN